MSQAVFISYSRADESAADAVRAALEAAGIGCWIDRRDGRPGDFYQGDIVRSIRSCRALVLVLSSRSNESAQVFREIHTAFEEHKPIIPFRIENVVLSDNFSFYISPLNWLDALTRPLEPHIERLVQVLRARLSADDVATDGAELAPPGADARTVPSADAGTSAAGTTAVAATSRRRRVRISGAVWGLATAALAVAAFGVFNTSRLAESSTGAAASGIAATLVLDREVTLSTAAGLDLSVRHPATWQLVSTAADAHIGLIDAATNSVFVTGLDATTDAVLAFVGRWALRMSAKYGRIELRDEGELDPTGNYWKFRIAVHRATVAEQGVLVVEKAPMSADGRLYRWWALLGQTDATIPTALAMANSLETRAGPGR